MDVPNLFLNRSLRYSIVINSKSEVIWLFGDEEIGGESVTSFEELRDKSPRSKRAAGRSKQLTPRNKIPWANRSAKTYVILVAERHVARISLRQAHFKP